MRLFSILLLLGFFLTILASYLLLVLNKDIVSLDILFMEMQLSLGMALLSFLLIGAVTTLILELFFKFRKKRIKK